MAEHISDIFVDDYESAFGALVDVARDDGNKCIVVVTPAETNALKQQVGLPASRLKLLEGNYYQGTRPGSTVATYLQLRRLARSAFHAEMLEPSHYESLVLFRTNYGSVRPDVLRQLWRSVLPPITRINFPEQPPQRPPKQANPTRPQLTEAQQIRTNHITAVTNPDTSQDNEPPLCESLGFIHPNESGLPRLTLNKIQKEVAEVYCPICPRSGACLKQGLEIDATLPFFARWGVWGGLDVNQRVNLATAVKKHQSSL